MRLRAFVRTTSIIAGILLMFFACQRDDEFGHATDEKGVFLHDFLQHTPDRGFKDFIIANLAANDCKKPFLKTWQAQHGQPLWDTDEPYYTPDDSTFSWVVPVKNIGENRLSTLVLYNWRINSNIITCKTTGVPTDTVGGFDNNLLFEYYRQATNTAPLYADARLTQRPPGEDGDNTLIPLSNLTMVTQQCRAFYVCAGEGRSEQCSFKTLVCRLVETTFDGEEIEELVVHQYFENNNEIGSPGNTVSDTIRVDPESPCGQAVTLDKDTTYNKKLNELQESAKKNNFEEGYMQNEDGSYTEKKRGTNGSVDFNTVNRIRGMAHSHHQFGDQIFSIGDLHCLARLHILKKTTGDFRFSMANALGEKFTLVIEDEAAFIAFYRKYGLQNTPDFLEKEFDKSNDYLEDFSLKEMERNFIDFLIDQNAGLKLLKDMSADSNSADWRPQTIKKQNETSVQVNDDCK